MMDILNQLMDRYIVVEGDVVMTLIRLLVAAFLLLLVGSVTVTPLLTKLISIPVNWCARGIPVGYPEYNGPDIEFLE